MVLAVAGTLWLLLPRGFPSRWAGLALMLPVFTLPPQAVAGWYDRLVGDEGSDYHRHVILPLALLNVVLCAVVLAWRANG